MASFQVFDLNSRNASPQEYKRRRVHHKVKSGCIACRSKRVKCDEARPNCTRCKRNGRECRYIVEAQHAGVLALTSPRLSPCYTNEDIPGVVLHHLQQHQPEILCVSTAANSKLQSIFQSSQLVRQHLLAISACHLNHRSPGLETRITKHAQLSVALREYRLALDTPRDILGQSGNNELLLSAVILNVLAFLIPEEGSRNINPYTSWVFSPDHNRLGWLSLQAGLGPLLRSTSTYLDESIAFLNPIFIGPDHKTWLRPASHNAKPVPATWLRIFSGTLDDVYGPPLHILAGLRHLPPHPGNVYHNFGLLIKMSAGFRQLLFDRDVKALWLFGYWLGLMCRFEGVWWWEQRVRRDYEAVKLWLALTGVADSSPDWAAMMEELQGLYALRKEEVNVGMEGRSHVVV